MRNLKLNYVVISFIFALLQVVQVFSQENLVKNPNAEEDTKYWKSSGNAKIETFDSSKAFVLRYGGSFMQDVLLPINSGGKYVLMIGIGSSNRVFKDFIITDHPYIYGYLMKQTMPNGGEIFTYMLGQNTLWESKVIDEKRCMWGVYEIADEADRVRLFLNQAERKGIPKNGSVARFDNVGIFILDDETKALKFKDDYCSKYE